MGPIGPTILPDIETELDADARARFETEFQSAIEATATDWNLSRMESLVADRGLVDPPSPAG